MSYKDRLANFRWNDANGLRPERTETMTAERTNPTQTTTAYTALKFDPATYRPHVCDMGLSGSQQDALLEAVWLIIVGVVDSGFSPRRISEVSSDAKTLVVDSASVLESITNSNQQIAEDA